MRLHKKLPLYASLCLALVACGEEELVEQEPSAPTGPTGPIRAVNNDNQPPDMSVPDLDETPACPGEGEQLCGAACLDTRADVNNCGECGNACGRGAGCRDGACFCLSGGTWCGTGECFRVLNDSSHCGACGRACAIGEYCSDGECKEDPMIAEVLRHTNIARSRSQVCGETPRGAVPPLTINELLNVAAQGHAEDMARRDYFDHDTPEGVTATDRMRQAGYQGSVTGENIAYGQRDAESVVRGWMNSPGHCRNIMSSSYTEIGIGAFRDGGGRIYWVQNFGAP